MDARSERPSGMLSRADAAEMLGISVGAFDANVRPYVPAYRIGRVVRWERGDLNTFLDSRALVPDAWTETVKLARGA